MNLKTSLSKGPISGAVLLSNLRTHWVWPCVMSIILCFNVLAVRDSHTSSDSLSFIYWFTVSYIFGIFFSVLTAMKLFMYLDKTNSVSFMHGIPVSRLKLYLTTVLSGGVITLIPPIVASALMLILQLTRASDCFRLYSVLSFLGIYAVYTLISFAVTTFAMTFCGNVIVSLMLAVGICVLPAALTLFAVGVCEVNLYGYVPNERLWEFVQKLYIIPENLLSPDCLIYIIGGIIFLALGLLIYMLRPLENCGEVVVFRRLRMLFTVAVGVVLGMISYLFFVGVFDAKSVLWMLPLGLVGVIGANMIARKTVGLRGSGIHIALYVVLTLLVSLGFSGDWFGYVRRVPDIADIKSVVVSVGDGDRTARISDPSEIAAVRALHTAVTEQADDEMHFDYNAFNPDDYQSCSLSFSYTLRNGLTVRRSYDYLKNENRTRYLEPLLNTESMKLAAYPVLSDGVNVEGVTIFDDRINDPAETYGKEQAKMLVEALRRDVESHTASDLEAAESDLFLRFEYSCEYQRFDGEFRSNYTEDEDGKRIYYYTLHYNENYENLIDTIGTLGYDIYNKDKIERVDELNIWLYDFADYGNGDIPVTSSYIDSVILTVTDKEKIRECYNACGFGWNKNGDGGSAHAYLQFMFIDNDAENENERIVYSGEFGIYEQNMPDYLKNAVREAFRNAATENNAAVEAR